MAKKILRISIFILLGLVLIFGISYLNVIDLSQKHRTRVGALPVFSPEAQNGEYRLAANNMEFLVRVAGIQNEGDNLILLHGFPESSIMWQALLDSAAARGYRVLAFDQRGYSPNARPKGKKAYEIDHLVSDVIAVADQVGFDTFHLVGHDWGSAVGWKTTMDYPNRVKTWTAMSIPHIGVFFDAVLNHPEQQKRSAYMQTLRKPYLPELYFLFNQDQFFEQVAGIWKPEEIMEYKAIHSEHGATTAALNWYRALNFDANQIDEVFNVKVIRPTLFIWGAKDAVVAHEVIPKQEAFIEAPYASLRLETGHSLIQSRTDSVLQAIFEHIRVKE